VSHYFCSDIHLRLDRPDRAERLATWVRGLRADDRLTIVGDLCDFWMASRQYESGLLSCEGIKALLDFRARGGALRIMAGNHDAWLCPSYERVLGAEILTEPHELTAHGLRLHLVHGHLLGARSRWKSWMESRRFHRAFGQVPRPLASVLDQILEWKNQRSLEADEERHLRIYRNYTAGLRGRCDLVVIGHVHRPVDDRQSDPRLIVLGGWQRRSSYLRIDPSGASFHVSDPGSTYAPRTPQAPRESPSPEPRFTGP
jgi:UDP-2,3-diacylglucosamine hydrolase